MIKKSNKVIIYILTIGIVTFFSFLWLSITCFGKSCQINYLSVFLDIENTKLGIFLPKPQDLIESKKIEYNLPVNLVLEKNVVIDDKEYVLKIEYLGTSYFPEYSHNSKPLNEYKVNVFYANNNVFYSFKAKEIYFGGFAYTLDDHLKNRFIQENISFSNGNTESPFSGIDGDYIVNSYMLNENIENDLFENDLKYFTNLMVAYSYLPNTKNFLRPYDWESSLKFELSYRPRIVFNEIFLMTNTIIIDPIYLIQTEKIKLSFDDIVPETKLEIQKTAQIDYYTGSVKNAGYKIKFIDPNYEITYMDK